MRLLLSRDRAQASTYLDRSESESGDGHGDSSDAGVDVGRSECHACSINEIPPVGGSLILLIAVTSSRPADLEAGRDRVLSIVVGFRCGIAGTARTAGTVIRRIDLCCRESCRGYIREFGREGGTINAGISGIELPLIDTKSIRGITTVGGDCV